MRTLVVGDGLMGQAIAHELGAGTVVVGHDSIDLTSYDSIVAALQQHKPDVAVNTAAYHRLMDCERNPVQAFEVNARGAGRLASLIPTVYLSTDYVFQGGGPHDEVLPGRQPRSVYGRSKLAGELETLEHDGIVVRISGVFDERFQSHKGPSFPEIVATKFDDFRFPNDQIFSPTYAKDAAKRIAALARGLAGNVLIESFSDSVPRPNGWPSVATAAWREAPGGIYHAANAGSASWASLARVVLAATERDYKVTAYDAKDAIRPTNSALRSTRLLPMRNWIEAVMAWADARKALLAVAA